MRRLFQLGLLLAALTWCVPAHAAITVANACSNYVTTNANTVTCTATAAAGTIISVKIARAGSATETITSVSDTGVNTYTASTGSPCTETTTARRLWEYHVINATAITSKLITVTFGGTNTNPRYLSVDVITGAGAGAVVDKETCNNAEVSSVADPGSTTLTYNNQAILEWEYGGGVEAVGTGYTQLSQPNGAHEVQYKVVTTGTWGASAMANSIANWVAAAITFSDGVSNAIGGFDKRRRYEQVDE